MNNLLYAIVFLFCFILFNLKLKKSISSPIILHSLIWLFVFFIGYNNYEEFYELESFFWDSWMLWFIGFAIGYYIFNFYNNKTKVRRGGGYNSLPNYSLIIYLISSLFLVLTIVQGMTAGYGNFIMNLRLSFIFKTNTLLQPFFFLFTFLWPLLLYEGVVYKNKKNIISLVIFMCIYTLASGGKFGVLMTFSALFFILNHRKTIGKRQILYFFVIGGGLITLISSFRGGEGNAILAYSYAPLVAYQEIEGEQTKIFGYESLRFFYSMFNSLGLSDTKPPEDFYEYVMTPIYVNVYTAFRPFYIDFGIFGVFLGALCYGLFFGYTYRGYLRGKLLQSGLYIGYSFAVVSIPFSDLLFLNLSLIFRTILIFMMIFLIFNNKKVTI